ncbi:MAG: hypothetical protein ACYCOU_22920 [Sulfobacillus sp.]
MTLIPTFLPVFVLLEMLVLNSPVPDLAMGATTSISAADKAAAVLDVLNGIVTDGCQAFSCDGGANCQMGQGRPGGAAEHF